MNQDIQDSSSMMNLKNPPPAHRLMSFIQTITDGFIFLIYRYFLIPMTLILLFLIKSILPRKIKETILDRENLVYQPLPSRPIWIHASSGEIEYAKSVIREIKKIYPQTNILVTYFSPSGKSFFSQIEGVDLFLPLPFDHRHAVSEFLQFYQPRCALFARTDVWPELSFQIRQRKIPSLLFSATFSENSPRLRLPGIWLNRWALNHLTSIQTVSMEDAILLLKKNILAPVSAAGDTRYDQVFHRLGNPTRTIKFSKPPLHSNSSRTLVMGSTWPEDEEQLFPALKAWLGQGHRAILVPHEIHENHLFKIKSQLESLGLKFNIYSLTHEWSESILIVDQMGLLQEFYKWADIAFVGGSFKGKVHSVMEALCLGIPVLVGPKFKNNREAIQFSKIPINPTAPTIVLPEASQVYAVTPCNGASDLLDSLKILAAQSNFHSQILSRVNANRNATAKAISWIEENLLTGNYEPLSKR